MAPTPSHHAIGVIRLSKHHPALAISSGSSAEMLENGGRSQECGPLGKDRFQANGEKSNGVVPIPYYTNLMSSDWIRCRMVVRA